ARSSSGRGSRAWPRSTSVAASSAAARDASRRTATPEARSVGEGSGSLLSRLLRRVAGGRDRDMEDVARSIRKLSDAQRDQTTALQSRLNALADLVAQRSTSKDATEIVHSVRALAASIDAPDSDAKLFEALDAVAKGSGPI